MAVFKVNKNNNYTVISNTHLKERKMTLKAKGLLTLMLSLPEDWDYSIKGLISICVEGERAINSTLNELKEFGYLRIEKLPPRKGKNQFEYIYNIYEKPLKKEERQLKNVEVQNVGLQNVKLQSEAVQNQGQLNTNTLSTKELNTKLLNTYSLFMEETSWHNDNGLVIGFGAALNFLKAAILSLAINQVALFQQGTFP